MIDAGDLIEVAGFTAIVREVLRRGIVRVGLCLAAWICGNNVVVQLGRRTVRPSGSRWCRCRACGLRGLMVELPGMA